MSGMVYVKPHTRNGKKVKGHWRKRRGRTDGAPVIGTNGEGVIGTAVFGGDTIQFHKTDAEMPWERDMRYAGRKNAKLLWLNDHPESKYNSELFKTGIKRIESMADLGVSAERRNEEFRRICTKCEITIDEGKHFIAPEFLK